MSSRAYQTWAAFYHVEQELENERHTKALQQPKGGNKGTQVIRYDLLAGGKRID